MSTPITTREDLTRIQWFAMSAYKNEKKAEEMGMEFKKEGRDFEYFRHVVTADSGCHQCEPEDVRIDVYETRR